MTRHEFHVFVPALTEGKSRPRTTRTGRMYTPAKTRNAEARIALAWQMAGCPRLPDRPLVVDMLLILDRPLSHFRVNGALTKAGVLSEFPTRKPDADNALKLALDALNGLAWKDDALVVDARVRKLWSDAHPSLEAGMQITGAVAS